MSSSGAATALGGTAGCRAVIGDWREKKRRLGRNAGEAEGPSLYKVNLSG
jgi:hypothetical protein